MRVPTKYSRHLYQSTSASLTLLVNGNPRKRGPASSASRYLQVSSIETECQTATLCARRSTKGYSAHEQQQTADATSIGAHSNSFTISDQISFLCCRPPIAAALCQASLAAHAAKGNTPPKEESVGASLSARSQSTFTDSAHHPPRIEHEYE